MLATLTGHNFDRLLDYAHDAGAHIAWGHNNLKRLGNQPTSEFWVSIQLPDQTYKRMGSTLETAAYALMRELAPDPLDQPE